MANDAINNVTQRSVPVSTQSASSSPVRRQDMPSGGNSQPSDAADKTQSSPASQQELSAVVEQLNAQLQSVERNLQFSIDDGSGQTVVKVVNSETNELIRQIPSEELLRISERIREQQESSGNSGLIFEISA